MMAKTILGGSDGLIHLRGSGFCTFETACGACDSGETYTDANGAIPTCAGCIDMAKTIYKGITKRELAECLKQPNTN
jgi:hypothetical protein